MLKELEYPFDSDYILKKSKFLKKKLLEEYRKQEAELNEKMRSVQVDIASIQNNIINIKRNIHL